MACCESGFVEGVVVGMGGVGRGDIVREGLAGGLRWLGGMRGGFGGGRGVDVGC